MRILLLPSLAALVLALAIAQQPRQPEPDEQPTISVDVDVVNILCSVRDRRGGLVPNLEKDDFALFEDGKEQTIRYFTRETDLPLTIGLLVDVSGSQARLIEVEKQAATQFFSEVMGKQDLAFIISFGSEAELLQDLTSSPRRLKAALDELRVNSHVTGVQPGPVPTIHKPRGTILFDTVYLASKDVLQGQVGRKVIVLITDGVDHGSRIKLQEAIKAAHLADSIIYSIYYYDPGAYGYGHYGGSDSDLKRMAEETGGRVYKVDRKNPLSRIFQELQEEMRSQYAIGYTPTNPVNDGSFRRVELKTRQRDLRVQARKGYYPAAAPRTE